MKQMRYDTVVIGGGAAGMSAAAELKAKGYSAIIIEREEELGGILMQCIHNGFGLIEFNEELSGPEFAQRVQEKVSALDIPALCGATVLDLRQEGDSHVVYCVSKASGVVRVEARAVILAMGCRERNRGNIRIPGSRPSGVFTAGLAQRLVNIEGYIPGKDVVIIGSGDIGLIMARRLTWGRLQGPRGSRDPALSQRTDAQYRPMSQRFRHSPLPFPPDHGDLWPGQGRRRGSDAHRKRRPNVRQKF